MYDLYNDIEEKLDFDVENGEYSDDYAYGSYEDESELNKTLDELECDTYVFKEPMHSKYYRHSSFA